MTNDLVKRLRDWSEYDEGKINDAREEAADQIEKLLEELKIANDKCLKITERCVKLDIALQNIADGPREANKSYAELFIEVCGEARDALQPPPIPEKNNDQ